MVVVVIDGLPAGDWVRPAHSVILQQFTHVISSADEINELIARLSQAVVKCHRGLTPPLAEIPESHV